MCGIIGIHSFNNTHIVQNIIEGLMCLQHRGQDGVGIANESCIIKKTGLVKNAFQQNEMKQLISKCCVGHVRYATNGFQDGIQPLYNTFPYRITMCHNGNIINTEYIIELLKNEYNVIENTKSDSQLLLCLYSCKLQKILNENRQTLTLKSLTIVSDYINEIVVGSYSVILVIEGFGMIVFRDKKGIRPLIWGTAKDEDVVCSESSVLNVLSNHNISYGKTSNKQEFKIRDVNPGETIIFQFNGNKTFHQSHNSILTPCLFEYIYFARSDSIIDQINVLDARISIGHLIGEKIKKTIKYEDIDVIVPVPDTSITFANGIQDILNKPMRYGLIKNRYIDRTFIMKDGQMIKTNVRRKITGNKIVFHDKTVLIVDDSIVRGNTSKHIIQMVRSFQPKKIIFASCAPIIRNTNQYGIYIPTQEELISYNRTEEDIRTKMGVDCLVYNDLDSIIRVLKDKNPKIDGFEVSMFSN